MEKWALIVGLELTAIGIIVGFSPPTVTALWSGPGQVAAEYHLQIRFYCGAALILIGTAIQIYSTWRSKTDY